MPPSQKYFGDEPSPDVELMVKVDRDLPLVAASDIGEDATHV